MLTTVATIIKGAVALVGGGAKRFEVPGLMGLGVDELFSTPAYWLEAAVLVAFFVIVNMFPCIRTCGNQPPNTRRGYLPTPIQALTDSLGRETTSKECCQKRECQTCWQPELSCQCPPWNKRLAPVCEEEESSEEEDCEPEPDPCADSCADPCAELFCETSEQCSEPKPRRRKKKCTRYQTKVVRHEREMPLGGLTSVKSHCRYLPGCKPSDRRRSRSRSASKSRSAKKQYSDPCCDPCYQPSTLPSPPKRRC